MAHADLASTVAALAQAGTHTADRLDPALKAGLRRLRTEGGAAAVTTAEGHFLEALAAAGAAAFDGGDPQHIEDALFAAHPDSPLSEFTFRQAWLAVLDALARTGDKPPFGGSGGAESWAFSARSRPWPFVDAAGVVAQVAALFGAGVQVVSLRGPGTSTMLAAIRRGLLAKGGADAMVPPVLPAARDDLAGVLGPYLERAPLEASLKEALPRLKFGEDRIGLLGRAGDSVPVALLLDDAQIQSRSVLLGLPLLMEPSDKRNALLVVAAPSDTKNDSGLSELLADARHRKILTEITLPEWSEGFAAGLLAAAYGADASAHGAALFGATESRERPAVQLGLAQAWIAAIGDGSGLASDAADQLNAGFDLSAVLPKHAGAQAVLARAALEGTAFHGFSVGKLLGLKEDDIEDLLHDDEYEYDDAEVGGCDDAVPSSRTLWTELPDGLHPVFRFADARVAHDLRARLEAPAAAEASAGLRDALMNQYQPAGLWQVADRVWRLDRASSQPRMIEQLLLGTNNAQRIEAGFRRLLPVLNAKQPYRLAVARLFGTAMEIGQLATNTGKVQLADQGFQAAAAAAQLMGRPGAAGEALARLGEVRLALSLPGPARQVLDLAEKLLIQGKQTRGLARVALLKAETLVLEGSLSEAHALLSTGVNTLREQGDQGHAALAGIRLGRLTYERGDQDGAVAFIETAIKDADASRDPRPVAASRMARAFIHGERNELDLAMQRLNDAAQAFQAARMPAHIVEVAAAGLQRRAGQAGPAEERLRKMAEAFKEAKAAIQWADAWHEVGRCLNDQGKFADATPIIEEVFDVRQRARDRFSLIRLHQDLATALTGQGDPGRAYTELAKARRFAERLELSGHLGRIDASMAEIKGLVDARPDQDSAAMKADASAHIDEMEALWAAPPQAPAKSDQVH